MEEERAQGGSRHGDHEGLSVDPPRRGPGCKSTIPIIYLLRPTTNAAETLRHALRRR